MDSKPFNAENASPDNPPDHLLNYQRVSLAEIDFEDHTFRITTRSDIEDLVASIQKIGLIQPPVLTAGSDRYRIVCGFRRIAACRKLGWKQVFAGILGKTLDDFKTAQLSIADNASQRPLNLLEESRALKLLDDFGPNEQQQKDAAETLGLQTSRVVAPEIKNICRLPPAVQEGILKNTINLSMARELGRLDPAAAEALLRLFGRLGVGLNRQRELLLLLKEIAAREDTVIPRLIEEKPLQEILKNTETDRAVKRQKVRLYLRRRRFPAITQAESDYRSMVRQLKLGKHIDLMPPNDFEGNTFSMTLRFKNRRELSDLKKKMDEILQHPALDRLFDR